MPIVFLLIFLFTEAYCYSFEKDSIADLIRKEVSDQLRIVTEKSNEQEKLIHDLKLKLHMRSTEQDMIIRDLQETVEILIQSCDCRHHGNSFALNSTDSSDDDIGESDLNLKSQSLEPGQPIPDRRIRKNPDNIGFSRKRLLQNNEQMVAFYAWMNSDETNSGPHHTLIFDGVQTNLGSAYDRHTGIFRTPQTGYYVFTWTIVAEIHGWIYSELIKNSTPFGNVLTNSQDIMDEQTVTGVVVLALKQGDDVYIRSAGGHGSIRSRSSYRSSFSGWRIA